MSEKNNEGKPFMDSIFGIILGGIVFILISFFIYAGWVNSGSHDGNFFGMAIRLPLERKDHYCWRKSQIIITVNTDTYKKCMKEE